MAPELNVVSISISLSGLWLCLLGILHVHVSKLADHAARKYFLLSYVTLFLFDGSNLAGQLMRGQPGAVFRAGLYVSNFIGFLSPVVLVYIVTVYLLYLVDPKRERITMRTLFFALVAANTILLIISQFTGLYYVIDGDNVYHRSGAYALSYIRVIFLGMIPSLAYNIGSGILRAAGDSRHPLYFLIAACLTNILLDALFVLVFRMGVSGAALATVLSQCLSASLVIRALVMRRDCLRLHPKKIRLDLSLFRRISAIGLPSGLQSVMYSISNVIIQRAINGFDTNILAGWTSYGKLDGLYWMTVNSFGIAITTFVGQNYGAGLYARVRQGIRSCFKMCFLATGQLSVSMYFGGGYLFRLFTQDEAVIQQGVRILRLLVPFYCTYIPIELLSGAMRGTGDTLIPTMMTLFGVCLLRAVWVLLIVPMNPTIEMVLYSYPITWTLTSTLFIIYYFRGHWMHRRAGA